MRVIGIDPGLTGAIAVVGGDDAAIIYDTPVVKTKGRLTYSIRDMDLLLSSISKTNYHLDAVGLERQQAFPGQGVASTFRTGEGYGLWQALIIASGLSVTIVSPQVWKKFCGLSKDKEESRQLAIKLFPECKKDLSRKKDHNRAEALLIAEYVRVEQIRKGYNETTVHKV